VSALREVFARFGVDFDASALVRGNAAVDTSVAGLQSLGSVIAGSAVVLGISNFIEETRAMGDQLGHAAVSLGLTTAALQEWQGVAGSAGVSAEQLTPAIQAMRRNASAAALAGGQMGRDFRTLGVTLRGTNGELLPTNDLIRGVFEGLAEVADPTERAAIAMRLLGESGARLGPVFTEGAAGVEAQLAAIRELGGGMSDEAIEASLALTWQQQRLSTSMLSLRSRIAVWLLPAVSRLTDVTSGLVQGFLRLDARTQILKVGLATLGAVAVLAGVRTAASWVAAALPFIAIGVALAALVLIVQDIWVSFQGGESVIANAIDRFESFTALGADDGPLGIMALGLHAILDLLTSIVQVAAQVGAGLTGLFGFAAEAAGFDDAAMGAYRTAVAMGDFGERDLALENDGSAAGELISARVAENRSHDANRGMITPDAFERVMATRELRASGALGGLSSTGGIVVNAVINANGLDEAAAARVARTEIGRAVSSANEETLDAVGGGA